MSQTNRQWIMASRPEGEPKPDNFRLETGPVPSRDPARPSCAIAGCPSIPICAAA